MRLIRYLQEASMARSDIMADQYLYQELDVIKKIGALKELPSYIESNLNPNIILRDYQEDAFRYFISYVESDLIKNKQIHTFFIWQLGLVRLLS